MATIEHAIEIAVPPDVAARDLRTFAYRTTIGQYRIVDRDVEWSAADSCQTESLVAFESLGSERTRLTMRVGYEPDGTPGCEPAVEARANDGLADFKRFTEERYRIATGDAQADVA